MRRLSIYVIYTERPDKLVVRRWRGLKPDKNALIITKDLREARAVIPNHCIPVTCYESANIKEVWI